MVCPLQAKAELQSPRLSLSYVGLACIATYGSLTSLTACFADMSYKYMLRYVKSVLKQTFYKMVVNMDNRNLWNLPIASVSSIHQMHLNMYIHISMWS